MSLRTLILLSPFAIAVLLGKLATVPEIPQPREEPRNVGMIDFTMKRYELTHRPLILFSPSSITATYLESMIVLNRNGSFLQDRDMVVVEVFEEGTSRADGRAMVPDSAAKLRELFGVEPGESAVVLVGKDRAEIERWEKLPPLREIFGTIDAMPMRQHEVEGRHSSPSS